MINKCVEYKYFCSAYQGELVQPDRTIAVLSESESPWLRLRLDQRSGSSMHHGDKSSRAQILKKASDYISFMRKKNASHQREIEELKSQNGHLEVGHVFHSKVVGGYSDTLGNRQSVTKTDCHSNSVTLIVLNESGIAKTVTVFFEFISFLLFFLYLFRAAPAEPERGQNLFQAPNWDGDRPAMDILVQFST